jgi:dTDP-4-dehydrorhamnose 3,5-epimerase
MSAGKAIEIAGVVLKPLKRVVNERGWLLEVQRNDDPEFMGFGQAYVTATPPGIVKAWYRHRRQIDNMAAVTGLLRLVLFDDRPDSPTRGALLEMTAGYDQPTLVQIPYGVWHGFSPIGDTECLILHLNSHPYDFDHTDEDRLPPDSPVVPYRWQIS